MSFDDLEKKLNKNKIKRPEVELSDIDNEKFPFEKKFKAFSEEIKTLPADEDNIAGVAREYVSTAALTRVYEKVFGTEGVAGTTLAYRIRNVIPEVFPNDFLVDPDSKRGDSRYYINRLNVKLLKQIFLPPVKAPTGYTKDALKNLQNLREFDPNFEAFDDDDDF